MLCDLLENVFVIAAKTSVIRGRRVKLVLWKSCAWRVKAGECLLLFFSCPVRANQRQSRADS
jgi:hypothetical protein